MNSPNYKAIANNEYEVYESLDNGKSWDFKATSAGANSATISGRIIYGSTTNQGLRYSDDEGVTIVASDHPTGNYDGIIWDSKSKVFAHSIDDGSILVSTDDAPDGIGSVWKLFSAGPSGNITTSKDSNGNIYFESDKGLVKTDGNSSENFTGAVVENGEVVAAPIDKDGYPAKLLYILNEVLLPKLIISLTGFSDPETLAFFSDGITWGNTSYSNFFSNIQLLQDNNVGSKDWTPDELRDLVSMAPFQLSIEDLDANNYVDPQIPLLSAIGDLDSTPVLKDTLDIITKILDIKKSYAARVMGKAIAEVPTECDNLLSLNLSEEEYSNALYTQKIFYEVQKTSNISIIDTILNGIYTFDTQRKIALLKAAIYETIIAVAPSIQYQLKQIEKKTNNPEAIITDEDLIINYNFPAGLETALTNYLNTVFTNCRLAIENPLDLKGIAAAWYKNNFRDEVLIDFANYVQTINIKTTDCFKGDFIEKINQSVERARALSPLIDAFIAEIKQIVTGLNDEDTIEIKESAIHNKEYADGVNLIVGTHTKAEINKILNELANRKVNSYDALIAEISNSELKSYIKEYIQNIYNALHSKMVEKLKDYVFDDYYDSDYDLEDTLEVQKLEKDLVKKFKERSIGLMDKVFENHLKNIGEDGYDYYCEEIVREIENGSDIRRKMEKIGKNFYELLIKAWYKKREII